LKIPVRKRGKGKHEHNPRDGEVSGVLNRPRWDACGKGTGPGDKAEEEEVWSRKGTQAMKGVWIVF
jgi:hypothetical protein